MGSSSWRLDAVSVQSSGTEILRGIDAVFERGTITLLIGPNGAGKTTLLETIAGLRVPEAGTITLGTLPLQLGSRMNREVLLRTGISFQQSSSQWFLPSVADEFRYSLRPYRLEKNDPGVQERIRKALEAAGMEEPEAILSRDPRTLSGGQQKRLALAMLLVTQPEWLLLDEPTAGLDQPGVRLLADILSAHRTSGGGAIIVTHDIEAMLPLSDNVVLIEAGQVVEERTAAGHADTIRAAAARSMPQPLALAKHLSEVGFETLQSHTPWAAPNELAASIAAQLRGGASAMAVSSKPLASTEEPAQLQSKQQLRQQRLEQSTEVYSQTQLQQQWRHTEREQQTEAQSENRPLQAATSIEREDELWVSSANAVHADTQTRRGLLSWLWPSTTVRNDRYDPRAIIISYYLFGTGILLQHNWFGLFIHTLAACLFVWRPLWSGIAPWRGAVVLYIRMIILLVLFAGVTVSPIGFNTDAALITGFRLCRLLIVMVTGLPIAAMVTPLRLQRALEQAFGWMERLRVPVSKAALTVALIFRFVPMLMQEWERFVRIAMARGKLAAKPGKLPARMIYSVLAPFLLGMLRGADEITNALEARGYGRTDAKPTRAFVLRWSGGDYVMVALFVLWFGIMYGISKLSF